MFVLRKIWRALFSWNTRFEIRPFVLLPSIKSFENKKVGCLGFVLGKILRPHHWFQFADDTAIITALEGDSQLLCNVFTKWTSWVNLIIRVDYNHTFGMKKSAARSIQYLPYIIVQRERIPPVELIESFIYRGRQFNFRLNIENIKPFDTGHWWPKEFRTASWHKYCLSHVQIFSIALTQH